MTVLEVAPVAPTPTRRVGWIDGARGLSIALMIASHLDYVVNPAPSWFFHSVLMRPVAPIFLFLLGALWRPGWRRRHWQLLAGSAASQLLALALGFALPNILILIVVAVGVLHLSSRWPLPVLTLAVSQLVFWPLPHWWTGYPIGFVVICAVAGQLVGRDSSYLRWYGRLGSRLGLEVVGRMPMRFYLGHLVALALLPGALA